MSYVRLFLVLACVHCCTDSFAQSHTHSGVDLSQSSAGKIDLIAGDVRILQIGMQPRGAAVGETVHEGDTLVTGRNGELHVTMQDTGFIALRPNTRIKIVSLKADGGSDDNAVFSLLVGSMRSITGWIGRYNSKAYQVRTPTATVGIRGTDHETRYIPPGSADGEPGTYDKVFSGETSIQTVAGFADVTPEHAGYGSNDAVQIPQVLPRIPAFFRPGPHEDLINTKHAEIQKMIEQRREERRKIVAEKLAALIASREVLTAQNAKNKADAGRRKSEAQEQQWDTDAQFAVLRARQAALKRLQNEIQDARQKIREKLAEGMNANLRVQLKRVRENVNTLRLEWQQLTEAYKAVDDENKMESDARRVQSEEQGRQTLVRLSQYADIGKALQEKQKVLQQRRDAIQAKNAIGLDGDGSLNKERKAVREAGEVVDREHKELLTAQSELFDTNIALNEARIRAAAEQRHRTADQLAALNDKELALQNRQSAQETDLMTIQELGAKEQGQAEVLRGLFQTVRQNLAALSNERRELLEVRMALREKYNEATDERQRDALTQLQEVREKYRSMRERIIDLQQERESMQEEIKMLYEQEQKRFRQELKADRQLSISENGLERVSPEP